MSQPQNSQNNFITFGTHDSKIKNPQNFPSFMSFDKLSHEAGNTFTKKKKNLTRCK